MTRARQAPTNFDDATMDGAALEPAASDTRVTGGSVEEDDVFASAADVPLDDEPDITLDTPLVSVLLVDPGHVPDADTEGALVRAGVQPVVVETAAAAVEELRAGGCKAAFLVVGSNMAWASNLLAMASQRYPGVPMLVWAPMAPGPDALLPLLDAGAVDALDGPALSDAALRVCLQGLVPELVGGAPGSLVAPLSELRSRHFTAVRSLAARTQPLLDRVAELEAAQAAAQAEQAKREKSWTTRVAALEQGAQRAQQDAARRTQEVTRLQAELDAAAQGADGNARQVQELLAERDAIAAELLQARGELGQQQAGTADVRNELAHQQATAAALETEVQTLAERSRLLEDDVRAAHAELEAGRQRAEALALEVRNTAAQVAAADRRAAEWEKKSQQAVDRATEQERRALEAEARGNTLQGAVTATEERVAKALQEVAAADQRALESETRAQKLLQEATRKDKDAARLQQQLADAVKGGAQNKVSLARLTARADDAERQARAAGTELEAARAQLEAALAQVKTLEGQQVDLHARVEDVELVASRAQQHRDQVEAEHREGLAALAELREENRACLERLAAETRRADALKDRLSKVQDGAQNQESSARAALNRADQAEQLAKKALADTERQLERGRQLSAELVAAREHVGAMQAELENATLRADAAVAQAQQAQALAARLQAEQDALVNRVAAAEERAAQAHAQGAAQGGAILRQAEGEAQALQQALNMMRAQVETHLVDRRKFEEDGAALKVALDTLRQQLAQAVDEKRALEAALRGQDGQALQARIAELESRLAAAAPEGASPALLAEIRQVLAAAPYYESASQGLVQYLDAMAATYPDAAQHLRNLNVVRAMLARLQALTA